MHMNYRAELLGMIDRLVKGEWSVDQFRDAYYDFYLEQVPSDELSAEELDFFGAVQERLDWTSESPNKDERGYGWMDHQEFIEWLRVHQTNAWL